MKAQNATRSRLSERALRAEKPQLERMLKDPALSEAAKAQARRSIQELDLAIGTIQRAPAMRDVTELGLIAMKPGAGHSVRI